MIWSQSFHKANPDLFFKSGKTGDPRFGEISLSISPEEVKAEDWVIIGYPDDEGIKINGGRPGAALAPDDIRRRFYKTTRSHYHQDLKRLVDIGNLNTSSPLSERHLFASQAVEALLGRKARLISLGGGHDYAYADGAGFLKANAKARQKPLVINFDAHLDVRPVDQGLSSGTPFYRLLTDKELPAFDFFEIGIQGQCNSQDHIHWAKQQGAQLLFFEDLMMGHQSIPAQIIDRLSEHLTRSRPTYISIDIDGFSTAYAMGCSQAWPTGFSPMDLFPVLNILAERLDVQLVGIYEVSPPLDEDEKTVKLAAQIVHQMTGPLR